MLIDSFSGAAADLKPAQRTPEFLLAVLAKRPRVSTWDMSELGWLRLIGLEGDDLSQIRGEQFQHKHCGGWLEVTPDARFVPVL